MNKPILIGKIVNTHGIKGELKVLPDTDFQAFRYSNQTKLWIAYQDQMIPVKVKNYRIHKGFDLLVLEGYEDINLVEKYKGCALYSEAQKIPDLRPNEYHINDLIGLKIIQSTIDKGVVQGIRTYPQGDYLEIVLHDQRTVVVPFRSEFVQVHLEKQEIEIVEMEGLL